MKRGGLKRGSMPLQFEMHSEEKFSRKENPSLNYSFKEGCYIFLLTYQDSNLD